MLSNLVSVITIVDEHVKQDMLINFIDHWTKQTHQHCELIIVANATNQYESSKIVIPSIPNVAIVDTPIKCSTGMAINYGTSSANGHYLTYFNINDLHMPWRIEHQLKNIKNAHITTTTMIWNRKKEKSLLFTYPDGHAETIMWKRIVGKDFSNHDNPFRHYLAENGPIGFDNQWLTMQNASDQKAEKLLETMSLSFNYTEHADQCQYL